MNESVTPRSLSHEEVLALSGPQRLRYVELVRLLYPRWNAILADIEHCHQRQPYATEPPCLLITGQTGVGKSTLIHSYAHQFPSSITDVGWNIPVLKATIPSPATVKNLLIVLLSALGDPKASSGTIGGMTLRLENFLRDCGVQILILDELQHFVDQDSQRVLLTVSNWLKRLIKDTGIACIVVGLQDEAEQVINANPQLARLFGDPVKLSPFQWIETEPDTIREFRSLLHSLEQMLPLKEPSNLAYRERAWRCFVSCDGIVSHLMALMRQATEYALLSGKEQLDDTLLAAAFTKRLAGQRRRISNPFVGDPPSSKQSQPSETTGMRATNRRRSARGGREPRSRKTLS